MIPHSSSCLKFPCSGLLCPYYMWAFMTLLESLHPFCPLPSPKHNGKQPDSMAYFWLIRNNATSLALTSLERMGIPVQSPKLSFRPSLFVWISSEQTLLCPPLFWSDISIQSFLTVSEVFNREPTCSPFSNLGLKSNFPFNASPSNEVGPANRVTVLSKEMCVCVYIVVI